MAIPTPVPPDVKLIGERTCPMCGYHFTAIGTGDGRVATDPTPGDRTVCMRCAGSLIFDDALVLREMTGADWRQLSVDELLELVQMKGRILHMHRVCGRPGEPPRAES